MTQGGLVGLLKEMMGQYVVDPRAPFYFMPAGWLVFELSENLPWRQDWCTAL
jgi:hypothetical protein